MRDLSLKMKTQYKILKVLLKNLKNLKNLKDLKISRILRTSRILERKEEDAVLRFEVAKIPARPMHPAPRLGFRCEKSQRKRTGHVRWPR